MSEAFCNFQIRHRSIDRLELPNHRATQSRRLPERHRRRIERVTLGLTIRYQPLFHVFGQKLELGWGVGSYSIKVEVWQDMPIGTNDNIGSIGAAARG